MNIEINFKKTHLIGPYYATISKCTVHRMSKNSTNLLQVYSEGHLWFCHGTAMVIRSHTGAVPGQNWQHTHWRLKHSLVAVPCRAHMAAIFVSWWRETNL